MGLFKSRNRDDSDPGPARTDSKQPVQAGAAPTLPVRGAPDPPRRRSTRPGRSSAADTGGQEVTHVGRSVVVKGDLSGDEDLTIEGRIEGRIHLPDHQLTIGASARIHAELIAKSVVVIGEVGGNINASERVEIHDTGIVNGDVRAPRLLIHEGALINGTIDMSDPNVAPDSQPGLPQSGLLKAQPSDDEPSD